MLTSLMIATVIGIIDSESKRHKVLLKQYETYERLKYKSEQFVCSLCEVANFQSDMNIFLSEKNFDMFYQKLIEYMEQDLPKIQQKVISDIFLNYSTKELSRELAIKMYFEQYSRALNNVNYALLTNEFIGPIEHAIEQIDSIHNELQMERLLIEEQKSCYTDIQLLKFVDGISREINGKMKTIRVVAAVIKAVKEDGRTMIFATQRGYGEFKGGWEFPGGKIEAGETPQEALKREIMEELDTEVAVGEWIETVEYDYPGFHLSMDCFWCEIVKGDLVLKEHEAARWLTREELTDVEWLPADVAVAEKIEGDMTPVE